MSKATKKTSFIALIVLSAWSVFAGSSSERGTSAANFLKIHPGARAAGMGGSFMGLADDVYALYYNAGGLGQIKNPSLAASHVSYFQGIQFDYLAFAAPIRDSAHILGFSITSLAIDDIEKRSGDQDLAESKFSAADYAYQVSYGRKMTEKLSMGANVKIIKERIDSTSANAYAADLGLHLNVAGRYLKGVGGAIRNLGSEVKFKEASDPLPQMLVMGAHAKLFKERFNLVLDGTLPRDNDFFAALGAEYLQPVGAKASMALRAGCTTHLRKLDGTKNLSLGFGFSIDPFSFDFAWTPYGDLGDTFRYSLVAKF